MYRIWLFSSTTTSLTAVSYTHLDVYKRQGFALPATAAESSQTQKLRFEAGESETAPTKLSQTLLDSQPETFSERDKADYAPDDTVRVSIVLKDEPAVAMYSLDGIGENNSAVTYRQTLKNRQNSLTQRINRTLDAPIDVVWNLTLAANLISANVRYCLLYTSRCV